MFKILIWIMAIIIICGFLLGILLAIYVCRPKKTKIEIREHTAPIIDKDVEAIIYAKVDVDELREGTKLIYRDESPEYAEFTIDGEQYISYSNKIKWFARNCPEHRWTVHFKKWKGRWYENIWEITVTYMSHGGKRVSITTHGDVGED